MGKAKQTKNKPKEFAITIIEGQMGSGMSMTAIAYVLEDIKKGKKVVTNCKLR